MGVEQERKKPNIHRRDTDTARQVTESAYPNVWPSPAVKRGRYAVNESSGQIVSAPELMVTATTDPVRDITIEEATPVADSLQSAQAICTPFVGMEFDSIEMVDKFWEQYGRDIGFNGRIHYTTKSRKDGLLLGKTYVCSRAGLKAVDKRRISSKPRPETRCNCPVKFVVCFNREKRKFYVKQFIEKHNHLLDGNVTRTNIEKVQAFVPTAIHSSHLRTKGSKNLPCGEASAILDYFDKQSNLSHSFFRAFQFDCEGKVTNFYWADLKMLIDYKAFGDVVTFYTSFGTDYASLPLGIFTGFNNYRQPVILGCTLLYGEITESFAWVLNKFIECHGGKYPGIIFTDQDPAMEEAIAVAMPKVRHGLCSWHIIENARRNLYSILGSKWKSFNDEFQKCMYDYLDVDLFEEKWKCMLESFGLFGNNWLEALYSRKNQCFLAYMKDIFTAGIRSTQLNGILSTRLKKDLSSGMSMGIFFISFDLFLVEIRNAEANSDSLSCQAFPKSPILRQAAEIYTPNMFKLFFEEWDLEHSITLDTFSGSIRTPHMIVAKDDDKFFKINFDPSMVTISCSCSKYEMYGYLCGHILRVFNMYNIREIPEKYIMKRWTINAKKDPTSIEKYDILCSEWAVVASRACSVNVPLDVFVDRFISGAHTFIDEYERESRVEF